MSYHGTGLSGSLDAMMADMVAAGELQPPDVDWAKQFKADWPNMIDLAAQNLGVDPAALLKQVPIPGNQYFALAAKAVVEVSGFFDGEVSEADIRTLVSQVGGAAAVMIGGAIGTAIPVPGMGTAVGMLIGALVNGVINKIWPDSAQERENAARVRAAVTEMRDAASKWENDSEYRAWTTLAMFSAYRTPSEQYVYAAVQHFDNGTQTPAMEQALAPTQAVVKNMLRGWGFRPANKGATGSLPDGYLSWNWADDKFNKPFDTRSVYGTGRSSSLKLTEYKRGNNWSTHPPTLEEKAKAYANAIGARLRYEQKIMGRWQAYLMELSSMRETVDDQVRKGKVKLSKSAIILSPKIKIVPITSGRLNMLSREAALKKLTDSGIQLVEGKKLLDTRFSLVPGTGKTIAKAPASAKAPDKAPSRPKTPPKDGASSPAAKGGGASGALVAVVVVMVGVTAYALSRRTAKKRA